MLLTLRFGGGGSQIAELLLGGETERYQEFWFGQGLAWAESGRSNSTLHFSLLVAVPPVVERTKRRDRQERFSIGFQDSYPYTASGLMALFLSRLRLSVPNAGAGPLEIDVVAYPERPHSTEIAQRLFAPAGYVVRQEEGRLRLSGNASYKHALAELPVLLLALDRRTRLFLTPDELSEIGQGNHSSIRSHPARRAIEAALAGRPTALRHLVPAGSSSAIDRNLEPSIDEALLNGESPISTAQISAIKLSPEQRAFARRAFSKIDIDLRWLVYLPSGIASLQSRHEDNSLEHPAYAIEYFRQQQIDKVIVEEKHMGSRGIVVLCRSHQAASNRFGVSGEVPGCIYTRNGRRFFKDEGTEAVVLDRLGETLNRANFWKRFSTDFVCLDAEILPWSIKASESSEESDLVESGCLVLDETQHLLPGGPLSGLKLQWSRIIAAERESIDRYEQMFKRYRTQAANLADLKIAPFHLLAVEGRTFFNRSHLWHMQLFSHLARSGDGFLKPTRYEVVRTKDERTWVKTLCWWDDLSAEGSEGFVVKPLPFVPKGRRGFAQPALKCRSKEHLRLVYGPNYDSKEIREALAARNSHRNRRNKHRRILRQFALSMEGVERFVTRKPLDAVHECVLGVLAEEVAPNKHE